MAHEEKLSGVAGGSHAIAPSMTGACKNRKRLLGTTL